MLGLRAKLPPPNSLVMFEAAARQLNFTKAAKELHVTQRRSAGRSSCSRITWASSCSAACPGTCS